MRITTRSSARLGVAWPDAALTNPQDSKGYYCFAGEQPQRFQGLNSLPSSGVYVTPLSISTIRDTRLGKSTIRSSRFLKPSVVQLGLDFGYLSPFSKGAHVPCSTDMLAKYANLMGCLQGACERLGGNPHAPLALNVGFNKLLPQTNEASFYDDKTRRAISDACNGYNLSSSDSGRIEAPESPRYWLSLSRHRINHARDLFSVPIPGGGFRSIDKLTAEQVFEHRRPLLLRCKVRARDAAIAPLIINFGGAEGRNIINDSGESEATGEPRQWLATPEFAYLNEHCDIEILEVLEGERFIDHPLKHLIDRVVEAEHYDLGLSVALDSLLMAGTYSDHGSRLFSAMNAWVHAVDRVIMMDRAIDLKSRFPMADITFAGQGRIYCRVPAANLGPLVQSMIAGTDLIPPMLPPGKSISMNIDTSDPVRLVQGIRLTGHHLAQDKLIEASISRAAAARA